jgi:hypothetical protein
VKSEHERPAQLKRAVKCAGEWRMIMDVENYIAFLEAEVKALREKNELLSVAAKGAIAALTQNKTYQIDIDVAKKWLTDAIK